MDYLAISKQALGGLQAQGVCRYVEAEELVSRGVLAILEARATEEPLAVVIARNRMCDAIDSNEVRTRGRVPVREGHALACDGEEPSVGDMWDETIHHGQNLQPEAPQVDLLDSLSALPPRQYRAVVLTYWGGMSYAEVGKSMGIKPRTVKYLLTEAKKNIANTLPFSKSQPMTSIEGKEAKRFPIPEKFSPFGLNAIRSKPSICGLLQA